MARAFLAGAIFAVSLSLPVAAQYARPAGDAEVLDEAGYFRTLSDFTQGRVTLLALTYSRCIDEQGCARATAALRETRSLLRADPTLQKRVRLVSLSIDPVHDVPRSLAAFAAASRGAASGARSEEHTSELQSHSDLVCRLLLEKKKTTPQVKCTRSRTR